MSPEEILVTDFRDTDNHEPQPIPGTKGEMEAVPKIDNKKRTIFKVFAVARGLRGGDHPVLRINKDSAQSAQNHMRYLQSRAADYLDLNDVEEGRYWHISSSGKAVYVTLLDKDEDVPFN